MAARSLIGGFLGVAAALGGCASTQPSEYTFDIAATTGMLALDIENFRGSVEVRADPRVEQATVSATSSASMERREDENAAIADTWIEADLTEESARAVLRVRTGSSRENTGDHWVDLVVRVPRCGGVRIDNRDGFVEVVGTSGGTTITNRLASVEFRTNEPMTDPVSITTTDGDIWYQVPMGSSGSFDLHTLQGNVWYRDRVQGSDKVYSAPGVYHARLNEGTNSIEMRTNQGNINVWVDEEPTELTRLFKRDPPNPQDFWFLQGSRKHTRNLPEDHPDVTRKQVTVNPYHDSY